MFAYFQSTSIPSLSILSLTLLLLTQCELPDEPPKSPTPPPTTTEEVQPARPNATKNTSLKIVSWNFQDLGSSKDANELAFAANLLKNYDIVAIQEVVTSPAGAQAVAKLVDELDRKGANWDYKVSDPTSGDGSERYAYLWKDSKVALKSDFLTKAKDLDEDLDREPYMARFEAKKGAIKGETIMLASFHAVPTSKDPEKEVILLNKLHDAYRNDNLMVMGDFNLSEEKEAFDPLKEDGYQPVLKDQKTSLKMKLKDNGEYLNKEYDNIFVESAVLDFKASGIIDFVEVYRRQQNEEPLSQETLSLARKISDHLPIWADVNFK